MVAVAIFGALFESPTFESRANAQEFRIESEVYSGDSTEPGSHNITLFSGGMIYDYQMSNEADSQPVEIAVYDSRDQSFVLIDCERNMRLEVSHVELIKMLEGLRQQTLRDDQTSFLINEPFEENYDFASGIVTLDSASISYRFQGKQPDDVSILPVYFQFIDQFSQLNASDPHKLPPFPRLRLNQSIQKFGWIPDTIHVTLRPNPLFRSQVDLTSKHTLIPELSNADQLRIAETKTHWLGTKNVGIGEYREFETTTSAGQTEPDSGK